MESYILAIVIVVLFVALALEAAVAAHYYFLWKEALRKIKEVREVVGDLTPMQLTEIKHRLIEQGSPAVTPTHLGHGE